MSRFYRTTGVATLSATLTPTCSDGYSWQLESVMLKVATVAAASLKVSILSGVSSNYNVRLNTQSMAALKSYHWQPTRPVPLQGGDGVAFQYATATRFSLCAVFNPVPPT